jgi:hypothetical protein
MIEALEPTLALFVPHEKPQLSPGLAASFSRNGRQTPMFPGAGSADGIDNAGIGGLAGLKLCPFLLAFWDNPTQRRGGEALDRSETKAVLPALDNAAHIRGTPVPAFRFVLERHNFATLFDAGQGRKPAGHSRLRSVPDSESSKPACRRLPETLPKSWANAGAFRDLRSRIN